MGGNHQTQSISVCEVLQTRDSQVVSAFAAFVWCRVSKRFCCLILLQEPPKREMATELQTKQYCLTLARGSFSCRSVLMTGLEMICRASS